MLIFQLKIKDKRFVYPNFIHATITEGNREDKQGDKKTKVKLVSYFWPLILCSRDLTFFQFPLLLDIFRMSGTAVATIMKDQNEVKGKITSELCSKRTQNCVQGESASGLICSLHRLESEG